MTVSMSACEGYGPVLAGWGMFGRAPPEVPVAAAGEAAVPGEAAAPGDAAGLAAAGEPAAAGALVGLAGAAVGLAGAAGLQATASNDARRTRITRIRKIPSIRSRSDCHAMCQWT